MVRAVVVGTVGLALGLAACSIEAVEFTGLDTQGTASLTVVRTGTSTGTVLSSPAGIDCGAACTGVFTVGTTVMLTAAVETGSELAGWSGGGCSGATPACAVTVEAATEITATFDRIRYPVTIEMGGAGGGTVMASAAGIACPGACAGMVAHGDPISLVASAAVASQFMGWMVAAGGTPCTGTDGCTTTITGPTTITATFALYQSLEVAKSGNGAGSVTSSPPGIDCGGDCSESYPPGTTVTLTTAADEPHSIFMGWSGGGCSGTGPCSVDVTSATMVTAELALRRYDLTVEKTGTGAGTVQSMPPGIDCGATCTAAFDALTPVPLTASASVGSTFVGWSGGGCSGTAPCTVTMAAARTVTATFTLNTYTLSVGKSGTGAGTVTSPTGINCGPACMLSLGHGATITLSASPAVGSTFSGWSGGGCSGTGTCTVTMTAATTVTAAFTLNTYTLSVAKSGAGTVTSNPAGINCGPTCMQVLGHGSTVTLSASPEVGSTFTGWSGGGCSGIGTCTVTMTAATLVTATFTLNTYTLGISKSGSGSGTVTSNPPGINCGPTCSVLAGHSSTFTLSASPAVGSTFSGWSGGGCSGTGTCTVTMTAATMVTAAFALNTYTLSVAKSGPGSGTVTSNPAGINCGNTCTQSLGHGSTVTLTASPDVGSTFAGWSGGGCSGTGTCTVTMTAATTVTAAFNAEKYPLTVKMQSTSQCGHSHIVSSIGNIKCFDNGTGVCADAYPHGTHVKLTLVLGAQESFGGWSGPCVSTQGPVCEVVVTGAVLVQGFADGGPLCLH